jgi:glyoxylate reductase
VRPRIFITQPVAASAIERLRASAEVTLNPDALHIATKDELLAAVRDNDVLFCLLHDRVDRDVVGANPRLRMIATMTITPADIDVAAATARRIPVTVIPAPLLNDATADLTWALILACARRLVEAIDLVRSGQWKGWHPELLLGVELRGRTLGLFGAGRIGQAVGRRAVPFGLRLLYAARSAQPDFERDTGAVRVEWPRLLAECDILSLHAPSTPETKGIVNSDALSRMKPDAILVNTARGDLIREEALAIALDEGRLGAAGLDVYTDEPAIHPRLLAAPRTVLLPHIGSATHDTRRKMAAIALANVQAVLRGEPPLTPVYR